MENVIIIVIVAAIIGGVAWYLYKSKKRGDTCIGCPYAKQCGGNCADKQMQREYTNEKE